MDVSFDRNAVSKVLKDYYAIVGVGVGLYDKDYNAVHLEPNSIDHNFCDQLRQHGGFREACRNCDQRAFNQAREKKDIHIYHCHIGLYEAVAPILDNDMVIGYVMIGQILDSNAKSYQWRRIANHCTDTYDMDISEYKGSFDRLKINTPAEITAMTNILMACASFIWYRKMAHIERGSLFHRVDTYIKDRLGDPLSLSQVCTDLKISRTTLYKCLTDQVAMGFTDYLKSLRLEKSQKLLIASRRPIKDIADEVGIRDYNYFSRLFKKTYGVSPSGYRKRYED